jgi:hypothetical protein
MNYLIHRAILARKTSGESGLFDESRSSRRNRSVRETERYRLEATNRGARLDYFADFFAAFLAAFFATFLVAFFAAFFGA